MEIIGLQIPLWALFAIGLVIVFVAWKIIKFAIKLFVILIVAFFLLIGLDIVGVFDFIQNLLSTYL